MPGSFFRTPLNGLLTGVVVGCVAITAMNVLDVRVTGEKEPDAVTRPTEGAGAALVDAWARMQSSVWSVDSTFVRTTTDGRSFTGSVHEAQRPPDRVRIALGSVNLYSGGRHYVCGASPDGSLQSCRDGGPEDYNRTAQRDLATLRSQVTGQSRTYDVEEQDGSCFRLFARPGREAGNWGSQARFCFDESTGAPTLSEFHRDQATDVVRAIAVRSIVPDEEFRLPGSG